MTSDATAKATVIKTRQETMAANTLMGIVTGVVADGHLADTEVLFLRTWLNENRAILQQWPASAIYRAIEHALADGVLTADERDHLLAQLQQLVRTDFHLSGAASPDGPALPIEDDITVQLTNAGVCHTGEFLFGTRAAVERATLGAGGMPVDTVTRRTDILVIGTRVSPNWVATTYGRKIQRAVELREAGTGIEIISERRWLQALGA